MIPVLSDPLKRAPLQHCLGGRGFRCSARLTRIVVNPCRGVDYEAPRQRLFLDGFRATILNYGVAVRKLRSITDEVPLNLMFSGTIFYERGNDGLQIEQIPWDREAKYRPPISVGKR